jgi:PAS domain S-box-containing protein
MRLTLSVKVFLFGTCVVLVTVAALVSLAVWQSGRYNDLAQSEVDDLINADLDHITMGIYNLVQTENEAVQQQVDADLSVAQHLLAGAGGVSLAAEFTSWMAVNQFSNERMAIRLPKMLIGGRWLGNNPNPAVETLVVDEVTRLGGESATIFERMNPRGDMLRVATTVTTTKGQRAVGTYIPAINPDGTVNSVVASVMGGKTYSGRAFVVNAYYLTAYQAITDGKGAVVGMLYVGVKLADVEARVRQSILRTPVGKTGYVYVLGGTGGDRGRYIISQRGERDGEDVWGSTDSDGRPVIQEIVKNAIALKPGDLAMERYRWQNPGESAPRWKVVRLAYFKPWDWVIGASAYEDELQMYRAILNGGRQRMIVFMTAAGFSITVLMGLLGAFLAWTILGPVRRLTAAVETVTGGNLDGTVDVRSRDEIGVLARTFNMMTERLKRTLEGLRQSEEKYRGIFENAIEGFFQCSLDGRFLTVNPAMAGVLGYDSPADLMERVTDIRRQIYVRPEDRDLMISALVEGLPVVRREVQFRRKDEQTIWVSLNDHLVRDSSGNPRHVEGFIYDISDRKNAEEALRQSEERFQQAQKMEAVGRLAGGIAHDFNNLLTVINGYADLLAEKVRNGVRKDVKEIQRAAHRAAALTSQLLAFSRKQVLQPRVIKLGSLIVAMQEMLQRLIGEDINLTIRSTENEGLVLADPGRIEQVVMNLVVNARDAMLLGGGKLTIETSNRSLDNEYALEHPGVKAGEYVQIAVSDTGYGMGKEVLSHLFEPFFTTKEQGKGTGLGLSTVYGIVKQSTGHITCYSELGKGTTFTVYFPRTFEMRDGTTTPIAKTATFRGSETILLVEDEEIVRRYAQTILRNNGYTVIAASGGSAALEAIESKKCRVALLVTDVVMPQMSGRELAQRLLRACPSVKVLFVSGYSEEAIIQQGVLDSVINFIQKPFSAGEFLKKIREILDGSRVGEAC